MKVDGFTWHKFDEYALSRLQFSASTLDERKRKLRHLENNGIDLFDFNIDSVYSYFAERLKKNAKPSTLNHYVKALNSWCKFRGVDHKFDQYTEHEMTVKIPTSKEISILLKNCKRNRNGKLLKTVIFTLAHTGMRVSELCDLSFDNIDYQRLTLTVTGKGNKTRVIPVKQYLLFGRNYPSIRNYVKHHRYNNDKRIVFTTENGPINAWYIRRELKKLARIVGLGWIHPHSFRHYYATTLLKKNVNLKVVQILLGHSNIKTTSRYLHMLEDDIFEAINRINFDDLLFDQADVDFENWFTDPTGEYNYGPVEIYFNHLIECCQPEPVESCWLTRGFFA